MTLCCPLCKKKIKTMLSPASIAVVSTQFGFQRDPGDPILGFHDDGPKECKGSGVTVKEAGAARILVARWTYPRPANNNN